MNIFNVTNSKEYLLYKIIRRLSLFPASVAFAGCLLGKYGGPR
jgi:hypothetical protein